MNFLAKRSLKFQLRLATLSLLTCTALLGSMSYLNIWKGLTRVQDLNARFEAYNYVLQADRDFFQMLLAERTLIQLDPESEKFQKSLGSYLENRQQFSDRLKKIGALPLSSAEKTDFATYQSAKDKWEVESETFVSSIKSKDPTQRSLAASLSLGKMSEAFDAMRDPVDRLGDSIGSAPKIVYENAVDSSRADIAYIVGLLVASVVVSVFSVLLFERIAKLLTRVAERLTLQVENIGNESTNVASGASQLSASSVEQAAGVQQTTSAVNELTGLVLKTSTATQQAANNASSTVRLVQESESSLSEMQNAISELSSSNAHLKEALEKSNTETRGITRIIAEIGEKTKVINEIVFQTKLLSFNASVEAARAGEHGKGFAVVAEEVGNLARMSGAAAQEISRLLDHNHKEVEDIITRTSTNVGRLMADASKKIDHSSEIVEVCTRSLHDISRNAHEIEIVIGDVSRASKEQSQGLQEINRAMSEIDSAAHQISQVSATAENAAAKLDNGVGDLKALNLELADLLYGKGHARPWNVVPLDAKKSHPETNSRAA